MAYKNELKSLLNCYFATIKAVVRIKFLQYRLADTIKRYGDKCATLGAIDKNHLISN